MFSGMNLVLLYIVLLVAAVAFQLVVKRLRKKWDTAPKENKDAAPKQYLVSEQDSTLKFILRRFYPVYRPDDKLNHIYRVCFKTVFFPVLVFGFVYFFIIGPVSWHDGYKNISGVVGWFSIGISTIIFLYYEADIPKKTYMDGQSSFEFCLIGVFMWAPLLLSCWIDEFLIAHQGFSLGNVSLLFIYAYGIAIFSIAMVRQMLSMRYMFRNNLED